MSKRIIGAILLAAGILVLVYGGFSYTEETHSLDLGVIELEAKDKERVNLPAWLGAAGIVAGIVLVVSGGRRR